MELLRTLEHPNIVRYIDFIKTEKEFTLVLEYVEQGSLLSLVKQFGTLPENLIANYVSQALRGLEYMHSRGVAHCDM
jgi:serine/threonine protein kinase